MRVLLPCIALAVLCELNCHAQLIEINGASVRANNSLNPPMSEFPFELAVSKNFELAFNSVDGELTFAGQLLGGTQFLFQVEVGDAIGRATIHDFDLVGITPIEDMPLGESYYGYAVADLFHPSNPELDAFGAFAWLRFDRDEDGFEVLESVVAKQAINGARLPVIHVGSSEACFFDTQGDIDGDGRVAFSDFLILSSNFNENVFTHELGDIDCNGTVEFADFLILSANFGVDREVASVPEPRSGTFLLLGILAWGWRRQRRWVKKSA